MENKHREPTLFIVGNEERKDEIHHILEDEWGGCNVGSYECVNNTAAYYVDSLGIVSMIRLDRKYFTEAVAKGWMKEYKLPEKPQFKPFDKVVTRLGEGGVWYAGFYSHYDDEKGYILTDHSRCDYCLPFNEQTAKLIGTSDEKGGNDGNL